MMDARAKWRESPEAWAFIFKSYLPRMAPCSLLWELVQLPLDTLWTAAQPGRIAFAVMPSTAGDIFRGDSLRKKLKERCRSFLQLTL